MKQIVLLDADDITTLKNGNELTVTIGTDVVSLVASRNAFVSTVRNGLFPSPQQRQLEPLQSRPIVRPRSRTRRHWHRSETLKRRIVREYCAAAQGTRIEILRKYKVHRSMLSVWTKRYGSDGRKKSDLVPVTE